MLAFPDPSFSPVVVLLGEDGEGRSAHIVLGQVGLVEESRHWMLDHHS